LRESWTFLGFMMSWHLTIRFWAALRLIPY
jgi:hypothetical protein